jgi:arrestin-related trafficking adapter 4/5/7
VFPNLGQPKYHGFAYHKAFLLTSSRNAPFGTSKKALKERNFFEKAWTFREVGKSKTERLKADNYEYPFDIVLEGSLPESVEGLPDSFVIYKFKAEIGRKYAKDIVVRKPLRIIRTVNPNALELAHAMVRTSFHIIFEL